MKEFFLFVISLWLFGIWWELDNIAHTLIEILHGMAH